MKTPRNQRSFRVNVKVVKKISFIDASKLARAQYLPSQTWSSFRPKIHHQLLLAIQIQVSKPDNGPIKA
jgi:hypothetical protein